MAWPHYPLPTVLSFPSSPTAEQAIGCVLFCASFCASFPIANTSTGLPLSFNMTPLSFNMTPLNPDILPLGRSILRFRLSALIFENASCYYRSLTIRAAREKARLHDFPLIDSGPRSAPKVSWDQSTDQTNLHWLFLPASCCIINTPPIARLNFLHSRQSRIKNRRIRGHDAPDCTLSRKSWECIDLLTEKY